jgi:dolichol-phosphate mannosyltransferase
VTAGPVERGDGPQKTPRASIVVPAFNEESGLSVVLEELNQLRGHFEIVVVDDGSTDRTAEVAAASPVRVVRHDRNSGKAEAVRTGINSTQSDSLVFIDGDGTYPATAIPDIVAALDRFDFVMGRRQFKQGNIHPVNRAGNWLFRSAIRLLYGFKAGDPLTGLYGLRRSAVERLDLQSEGFGIETEIASKASATGLSIGEVPIEYRERVGASKLRPFRDGFKIIQTIGALLFFYNPSLLFVYPGAVLFAVPFLMAVILYLDDIRIGGVNFSDHALLVSAMASLAGFQILLYGSIANLYAVAHKFTRADRLTGILLSRRLGNILLAVGLLCSAFALTTGVVLWTDWATTGYGAFRATKDAVIVAAAGIYGIEILFSAVFVGQLAREVRHTLLKTSISRP